MAALAFLGPIRAVFAAPAADKAAPREIVFPETRRRIPERNRLVAQWRRDAQGRLVCDWTIDPTHSQILSLSMLRALA